jgi:hypothetical protein
VGGQSLRVERSCTGRGQSSEEIGSHEPVVNPSADPAENKTDDGRALPVAISSDPHHAAALICGKRKKRNVASGKGGNESNEFLFMIGEVGREEEAFDLRLMQPIDFLCDLQGYGQRFSGKVMGYFDSGSTSHLCPHIELFDEWMEFKSWIVLPNKSMMVVLAIGKVGALKNVLYVLDLDQVVISIGKLDEEGYRIVTFRGKIEVFTEDGEIMFTGSLRNGMYQLDPLPTEQLNAINIKDGSAPKKFATTIGEMSEVDYLHHRWGHPTEKVIKESLRRGSVDGTLVDPTLTRQQTLSFCPDCIRGKMSELPAASSETDYSNYGPLELVATQSNFGHYKYFDLFSYKSSHWMSARFKKTKDEVYKNIVAEINQVGAYGFEIKQLQTDDDAVYRSEEMKKILDEYGINKRTTVPYHHSSNGWIERQVRTVMEKARTIMLLYDCPLKFWAEAISCAVYLYNVTPSAILDWKTPYELVFGSKPDISNLVPFYSPGIVYLSAEERENQFSPKGLACRIILSTYQTQ